MKKQILRQVLSRGLRWGQYFGKISPLIKPAMPWLMWGGLPVMTTMGYMHFNENVSNAPLKGSVFSESHPLKNKIKNHPGKEGLKNALANQNKEKANSGKKPEVTAGEKASPNKASSGGQASTVQTSLVSDATTDDRTKSFDASLKNSTFAEPIAALSPEVKQSAPKFFLPKLKDHHYMVPLGKDFAFPSTDFQMSLEFRSTDDGFGLISMRDQESSHDREIWFQGGLLFSRVWSQAGDEIIFAEVGEANDGGWHRATLEINSQSGTTLYFDGTPVAQGRKKKSEFDWATDLHIGYTNLHMEDTPVDFYSGDIRNVKVSTLAGDRMGHWPLIDNNLEDLSPYGRTAKRVLENYER